MAGQPPGPGWYPPPGPGWYPPPGPLPPPLVWGRPLADPGPRLAARLIDGAVLLAVNLPLVVVGFALFFLALGRSVQADGSGQSAGVAVLGLLVFGVTALLSSCIGLAYETWLVRRDGQTLGKKAMGLRVVRLDDGSPPTGSEAFVRALVNAALSGAYVDALWCLWDKPLRQCLHDKAVRTVVVVG